MANKSSEQAADAKDDNIAVVLDGEQDEQHGLHGEVSQKLDGLAKARKIRPWHPRRFSDDMSLLEEHYERPDEPASNGKAVEDDKSKSRLDELLTTFKSDDGKHTPRATFKPIRLAVAKARDDGDSNTNNVDAVASTSRQRETTLTLPALDAAGGPAATSTDVLDGTDNDDAASYIDFPQGPSPTITRTSSGSTVTSQTESENNITQWIHNKNPFAKFNNSPTSTTSPTALPDASQNTSAAAESSTGATRTTTKWKKQSKKGSKVSSQGDLPDLPQATDYAEIDTTKPRAPKRSDTFRGILQRSDSANFKRNGTLRLSLPFRERRKRRKGKGKMVENESSSDEGLDDEEIFQETLRKAGLFDRDVPEQIVTEALWQNERGIHLLGSRYGRNALLPGDPGSWTDLHGNATAYNTSNFPLPTPAWRWHHAEWLISMIGDVDSEGYQYSTRFSSKYWRGIPEIRFFVRRRLWIRTRYRPALKAQTIAQFSRPQAEIPELANGTPRAGLQSAASIASTLREQNISEDIPFHSMLARHIDPRNPFISWYALKTRHQEEEHIRDGRIPLKHEVVHANYLRVAKVLVRRTIVDRERLAWLEYWLGHRQEALHVTDMQTHNEPSSSGSVKASDGQPDSHAGSLTNIAETDIDRPDIRDVWDLLEDQLNQILGLFEYQETRRELLMLLKALHNASHSTRHYKNRSSAPDHPSEILARHEHGGTDEMGSDRQTRAENGDGTHSEEDGRPRLAFWTDLDNRLKDIQVATALSRVKENQGPVSP